MTGYAPDKVRYSHSPSSDFSLVKVAKEMLRIQLCLAQAFNKCRVNQYAFFPEVFGSIPKSYRIEHDVTVSLL